MAKKKNKPKRPPAEARHPKQGSESNGVLFGWREPRKRSLCRPSSAYRFLADLNGIASPNLHPDERYLYLGAIPNRPGHCAAIEVSTGNLLPTNAPEDFEELPEGED